MRCFIYSCVLYSVDDTTRSGNLVGWTVAESHEAAEEYARADAAMKIIPIDDWAFEAITIVEITKSHLNFINSELGIVTE